MADYKSSIRNTLNGKNILAQKMQGEREPSQSEKLSDRLKALEQGIKSDHKPLGFPEITEDFIQAYERNCECCGKKVKGLYKIQAKYRSTALWEMNHAFLCETCLKDLPNMNLQMKASCACGEEFWTLKFIGDTHKHTRCKKGNKLRRNCGYCGKSFETTPNRKQKFCDKICATLGRRSIRSHMEELVEIKIRREFDVRLICNDFSILSDYLNNDTMLELDFWFPQLYCAIELNGGFHRKSLKEEDEEALKRRKLRDELKEQVCKEMQINLVVIDFDDDTRATQEKVYRRIKQELEKYMCWTDYQLEYA